MFDKIEIRLDQREIDAMASTQEARHILQRLGNMVADTAQHNAEDISSAGAASIHAEVVSPGNAWEAHVSWDKAHWYMSFWEFGTKVLRARSFLRAALRKTYRL